MNCLVPAWPVVMAWPGKGDQCIARSGARALTLEADTEFNPYSETEKQCRMLGLAGKIAFSVCTSACCSAGVTVQGIMRVDSSFVRSQVEFTIATEAKLNLVSDIDFYKTIALCLQLRSPDSVIK